MDRPTMAYSIVVIDRCVEHLRVAIVMASALALILAGPSLPF
jgi:hypothetical protein